MFWGRLTAVLAVALTSALANPQPMMSKFTNQIQPRMDISDAKTNDCLSEGTHVVPVGETVCVASPGYPDNYDNNADSKWYLEAADSKGYLTVSCEKKNFEVQRSKGCKKDKLIVKYDTIEERYCGKKRPQEKINTTSNWIDFIFKSNARANGKGFICFVTAQGSAVSNESSTLVRSAALVAEPTEDPTEASTEVPTEINCGCGGLEGNTSRVVGGSPASGRYLVALVNPGTNRPWCGGSLYNRHWIITAAHCVVGKKSSDVEALLGVFDWFMPDIEPTRRGISIIVIHPHYNVGHTKNNDIALLRMPWPVEYSWRICPVCMPWQPHYNPGMYANVIGWGRLSEDGPSPKKSYILGMHMKSLSECEYYNPPGNITENMFCAGTDYFEKAPCNGDDGGPLTVNTIYGDYLTGIFSWSVGCAKESYYPVFTKVYNYIHYIRSIAGF